MHAPLPRQNLHQTFFTVLASSVLGLVIATGMPPSTQAQTPVALNSIAVISGTIASGDIASLAADDDVSLVLNAAVPAGKKGKKKPLAEWYASATVADDTIALRITLASSATSKVKQRVALLRWKNSKWKPIDNANVTAVGSIRVATVDSAFQFVSPSGEVRIAVLTEGKVAFSHSSDQLLVEVFPAGSFPDDGGVESKALAESPRTDGGLVVIEGGSIARGGVVRFASESEVGSAGLAIYDPRGRQVALLVPASVDGANRMYAWDGTDTRGSHVARGVYFARVFVPAGQRVQRFVWLRN